MNETAISTRTGTPTLRSRIRPPKARLTTPQTSLVKWRRPPAERTFGHTPAPKNRGFRWGRVNLLLTDLLMLVVSSAIAIHQRNTMPVFPTTNLDASIVPVAAVLVVLWLACLAGAGAYQWKRVGVGASEYTSVLIASVAAAGLTGMGAFLGAADFSRGFLLLLFVIGTSLLLAGRFTMRRIIQRMRASGALSTPVMLVGDPVHVDQLATVLDRTPWLGFRIIGALSNHVAVEPGVTPRTPRGLRILGRVSDVPTVARETDVEIIMFTGGAFPKAQSFNELARELEDHHAQLVVSPALTDVSAQRMNMRPVAGLPLVFIESPGAVRATRWAKRTFDLVVSSIVLIIAAPVMGLIALAIKLEDHGPVLFSQTRAGLKGKPFPCFKFRSMVQDAEERLAELRRQQTSGEVLFKMKDDPRITRVGRVIRRFSLDELPQLINVLRGDMSLVGPRPALPSEVAQYQKHVHRRLDVRPGLTGLWQVSGRSDLSWDDTVRLDLYYVDNWSLMQDLSILVRTVGAVLSSRGAY